MRRSDRSELVAVASRSLDKAEAYAKDNAIHTAYGSYDELIADPQVDAIYNPLPNTMHAEWTIKAAAAGKHVLCEKPIVTTLEDLDQVEAASRKHGVVIFEAISFLHHPQIRKIQQLFQTGQLGELQLIQCWDAFYLPPEDRDNIRLKPELAGGSFWDVGVYPNCFAITVANAGLPVEVWANQTLNDTGVDIALAGQLRFANDVVAQLSSGFLCPPRRGALITGSSGMLQVMDHLSGAEWPGKPPLKGKLTYTNIEDKQQIIEIPAVDAYLCEVQAMEACILDGAKPVVPLSRSRDFLKSVLALYESARTGRVVKLR